MYLQLLNGINDTIGINEVECGVFEIITGNDENCNSIVLDKEELRCLMQIFDLFLKREDNKKTL